MIKEAVLKEQLDDMQKDGISFLPSLDGSNGWREVKGAFETTHTLDQWAGNYMIKCKVSPDGHGTFRVSTTPSKKDGLTYDEWPNVKSNNIEKVLKTMLTGYMKTIFSRMKLH